MPISSAQMKALCLLAEPWTLCITLKAFFGSTGCAQCCRWSLYNLAALGNYKDKWREARSITHPVREGGLRLGNFVFSKPAPTPMASQSHTRSSSYLLFCMWTTSAVFFSICLLPILPSLLFHSPSPSPSTSLAPSIYPSSFRDLEVWTCSFTLPLLHKLLLYLFASVFQMK